MTAQTKPLTQVDYQEAKRQLVEHAAKRSDIVACWQYGEVSQPGVSDLDVIVVIRDDPEVGVAEHMKKEVLPLLVREAMAHASVIVVPESAAPGVFFWDDIKVTDMATGCRTASPMLDEHMLRIAMLVDWTFERTYRIFLIKALGLPNKRFALGMMKSYGYCVENFRRLAPGPGFRRYDELKGELTTLRNDWLSLDAAEQGARIDRLFAAYHQYARSLQEELFRFIAESGLYPAWSQGNERIDFRFPDGMTLRFVDTISPEVPFRDGKPVVELPNRLLRHFGIYLKPETALSRKLRESFYPQVPKALEEGFVNSNLYADFLAKRMGYCNRWYDFLKQNQFTYGLFKYGWYLNT